MKKVKEVHPLDLKLSSYDYELPKELIAQYPKDQRDHSRLMVYDEKEDEIVHAHFYDLPHFLEEHTQIIFNQSKVFPARLFGKRSTGARVELFFASLVSNEKNHYELLIKASSKKNIGDRFHVEDLEVEIQELGHEGTFWCSINKEAHELYDFLEKQGEIPIPPYIRGGKSNEKDRKSYQTVYSKELGSVAAPTAGLHFTHSLLETLKNQGMGLHYLTLHVGLGTFKPVVSDHILDHLMHSESFDIDHQLVDLLNQQRRLQRPILNVGTTTLRVLETIFQNGQFQYPKHKQADLFINPSVVVESVDQMITNFHLPKSSLVMLVSSLLGREKTLMLYRKAVEEKYRFFSYGDAMFIKRDPSRYL